MLVSENKKWLYFEETLIDLEKGLRYNVNNMHPVVVCEFFKEHTLHNLKLGLNDKTQIFSNIKKLIYPLISFDPNIVLEYEVKYGMKLITENIQDSLLSLEILVIESWDFVKNKLLEIFPIGKNFLNEQEKNVFQKALDATKKITSSVISSVKEAASYVLKQGLPWFFDKLEKFLLNPVTIGADVALSMLGIGKVTSAILWGSLGIWKLYQLSIGKMPNTWLTYLDIGCCFLGLILTGAAVKPIKRFLNANRTAKWASIKKSPILAPLVKLIELGATGIKSLLLQPIKWLSNTLGLKSVSNVIQQAQNSLTSFSKNLNNLFREGVAAGKKAIKTDITNPIRQLSKKSGQEIAKAGLRGVQWGAGMGALTAGIEKYAADQVEKQKQMSNQLLNPEIMNSVGSTMRDEWAAAGLYD